MHLARVKEAFGWNWRTWSRPLLTSNTFQRLRQKKDLRILEIGAGKYSAVSILFDGISAETIVGYYGNHKTVVEQKLAQAAASEPLKSIYRVELVDAFNVEGEFDLIIMKSVLGGLFREKSSSIDDVNRFISRLKTGNLRNGGLILTFDNGKSIAERLFQRLGSRRNKWRYFGLGEIADTVEQRHFGTLAAFSVETRLGKLGAGIDTILYGLDRLLGVVFNSRPTVILSVIER